MRKARRFYLASTALLLLGVLLTHLALGNGKRMETWLNLLLFGSLFGCYTLAITLYYRRESRSEEEEMGRQIEELLSDPAKEAPPDNLAVLRLAAHIKDNERSIRIINAYTFHELRNGIAMLTSKLQAGYSSQELLDSFSELNRSVEDLLALSAVRNDTWEKIDLAMVCAMVVDDYRKKYRDIHFLFEESVSPVRGRVSLAYSAVANLVDNAIKYGDGAINVGISERVGSVILFVENTGEGLTREQIDGMFDFQKRMNNLKKDGYGIGLSLVKNVAEVFGGFVWVTCRSHTTRFYLSAPTC